MSYKTLTIKNIAASFVFASVALASCNSGENAESVQDADAGPKTEISDSAKSTLLTVNGEIFSVPSPIQTAFLIKQVGANYNKEMLNSPKNNSRYSSKFQKAVNLGVYGADLGYVSMYDQTQDALAYLATVRTLADELGISGAFDMSLMDRFQKNMGNKDSILALVSDAYRASDSYLKNNQRNDVGALVLAGGWIESLYFATRAAKDSKNPEVVRRVGEQKKSLENLIKLLSPYYNNSEFTAFIDGLIDLAGDFDGVQFSYVYEQPVTDAANKVTTINSRTEVRINDEQLESITKKVQTLRNQIVG